MENHDMKEIPQTSKITNAHTIDEYIACFEGIAHERLCRVRELIKEAAPTATEKIAWNMPTFHLNKNLVHFAAAKRHIGFYPTPDAILHFREELKNYKTSKGAVQFPLDKPLPEELIVEIVKYRLTKEEV